MENTNPLQDGTTPKSPSRKIGLIGGAIGAVGLAASIFALSATASATAPELTVDQSTQPAVESVGSDDAIERDELPEGFQASEECWLDLESRFGLDEAEHVDDAIDWEAFEAAAEACEALLPQELQDQIAADDAAWADFDACVDAVFEEHGGEFGGVIVAEEIGGPFGGVIAGDELDIPSGVSIMAGDEFSFAEFGEGDGSITIAQLDGSISVTTDGDVTVEDFEGGGLEFGDFDDALFEEIDAALADCDDKLPEGAAFVGDFDGESHVDDDEADEFESN